VLAAIRKRPSYISNEWNTVVEVSIRETDASIKSGIQQSIAFIFEAAYIHTNWQIRKAETD